MEPEMCLSYVSERKKQKRKVARLMHLGSRIRIDAVDFDDWRTLSQIRCDNDLFT
jgi:hypothetical protein